VSPYIQLLKILVCLLCAEVLISCSSRQPVEIRSQNETILRIGVPQVTGQEDPLRGIRQAATQLSTEGLAGNNREGRATPRLAESWSPSPDGIRWTFRLRHNAKFHDGSPVDALSVKRSLEESLADLIDRSLVPGLDDIVGIEVTGPLEFVITLRNRSTFFLEDLSIPISKRAADSRTVGTGPFIVKASSPESIVMSTFPEHYLGTPRVEEIVWKPYPALRTAWAGMMRGEIDFLYEVGQDTVEFVEGETSVSTFTFLRPYVFGVVFNSTRQPFKDQRVRRALNFAVNRQLVVDQGLKGRGIVAYTPVYPDHWAFDQTVPGYSYDPIRGAAILDESYRRMDVKGPAKLASPARFRFTCLLIENLAHWERMALLVQKQLFEIGVDMKLEAVPAKVFNARVARGEFDAVFLELISGRAMSKPYFFWHSQGALNSFGYRNEDVDEALNAIRTASDDAAYRQAVSRFQRSLVSDPPGIFLAWGQTTRAVSKRFEVPTTPGSDILASLGSWLPARTPEGTH
jgi:peptide/nickel transport system substrate-binding protein